MLSLKRLLIKLANRFVASQIVLNKDDYTYLNGNVVIRRCGNVVHLYIGAVINLPQNETIEIFTLPDGHRPPNTMNVDALTATSTMTNYRFVRFAVAPNGTVSAYNYSSDTGSLNVRANITYIISEAQANVKV